LGFIIIGGMIIWMGIDLLEGNGIDLTERFINQLLGKNNE